MPLVGGERDARYRRCERCSASLIADEAFAALFAEAQPERGAAPIIVHNDGSERLPCPVCRNLMDVAWIEFLRLQRCENHGTWFEPGALARALAYDVMPDELDDLSRKWRRPKPPPKG